MAKIIIGLVGEIAAGKGTVVKYLEEKREASSHKFSSPLRDGLERFHLEINRKNMQDISRIMREHFGQNLLAKVIAEDAKKDKHNIVVIDGIRRPADIEYLKNLPEFKLVYIMADMETRYERLINRSENADDKTKTFEEFKRDHEAETEIYIKDIGSQAEYKINNNSDFNNLYRQIDKIIQ
jgi:dephospho-CoA kinase